MDGGKRPLVITGDAVLRQELERACAGAGLAPDVADASEWTRAEWGTACCVLVGVDRAADLAARRQRWRSGVVLVSAEAVSDPIWELALAIRAEHVCVLPERRPWLASYLVETADRDGGDGHVIGILAGRGGAGSSTLATALAQEAARAGWRPILVDGDPLAGGLELIVGCEDVPGLRWKDVAAAGGRVSASALHAALPKSQGTAVLATATPGWPTLDQLEHVITAIRGGVDLAIVDLPRRLDQRMLEVVGSAVDSVIVVTTADVRSAAGARRFVEALSRHCDDVMVAVRSGAFGLVPAEDVAASVGAPLAITIATRRAVQRTIDEGLGPTLRARERRQLRRLLEAVALKRHAHLQETG